MLGPSSFDSKLYGQIRLAIGIQRDLSRLKMDNIKEVGNFILDNKEIIETQAGISILSQCINDIADFHPKDIESLVELFLFL